MVAWSDDLTWSVRDERRDFDGEAGYPEWAQEDAIVHGLRGEFRRLGALLDAAVAQLLDAEHPVTAGAARDERQPAAFEEQAA